MFIYRALYTLFVLMLATSPVISLLIASLADDAGRHPTMLKFLWVGVGLSLPLPLLIANLGGSQTYAGFWTYLESFPHNSKKVILTSWLLAFGATALIGLLT